MLSRSTEVPFLTKPKPAQQGADQKRLWGPVGSDTLLWTLCLHGLMAGIAPEKFCFTQQGAERSSNFELMLAPSVRKPFLLTLCLDGLTANIASEKSASLTKGSVQDSLSVCLSPNRFGNFFSTLCLHHKMAGIAVDNSHSFQQVAGRESQFDMISAPPVRKQPRISCIRSGYRPRGN